MSVESPLRILLLEDSTDDAGLIRELLEADHFVCEINRVQTRAEFLAALDNDSIDLILSDYTLPSFDGLSALKLVLSARPDLPFIFVSGTLGEEVAVEALKIGATDYVLKTRLSRLVPAVYRALRETEERAKRKLAEEALCRSERELRKVIETIPAMVWSALPDGSNVLMNSQWIEYTGSSPAGLGWQAAVHPDDLKRHMDVFRACSMAGKPFEDEVRLGRADGEYRWFFVQGTPLRDEQGKILKWYGIVTDIEDRKRAEETLREQANLLNLTYDPIFVRDMSATIGYWNRGAEELYGWSAEEAKGKTCSELLQTILPMPLEQIKAELLNKDRWEGELVRSKKDGTKVIISSRWSLQRDKKGTPIAILETNNDITERKRAEEEHEKLRQLEADLAHLNRVSTMGELAASLSHELRQPISAAITNAKICLRWLTRDQPDVEEAREATKRVTKDATRAAEVIDHLRYLYKKGAPAERMLVDVNEVVREMLVLLHSEANRYSIAMHTDLAVDLPRITADRVQLQQVLMNLMLNGIEAMKDVNGTRELIIKSQRAEDEQLLVSVSDTGVGLPPHLA
ncbi:MAG TPA: PAS domain S-box protein, partial [Terriglobales bacterium]|nr:PAS domain S-box protein [Terriglobales bacterium]